MSIITKQDFSNPLKEEILKLKSIKSLLREELEVRNAIRNNYVQKVKDFASYKDVLEDISNRARIVNLENEIKAKDKFLADLEERNILDEQATEEDYKDFEDNYQKAIDTSSKLTGEEKLRADYCISVIEFYKEEKEACVFYFKALKYIFLEAGINE